MTKFKKIASLVMASAMAMTMVVGSAIGADATSVTCTGGSSCTCTASADGGFYYNGVQVPYGTYDANISAISYNCTTGVATVSLQSATYTVSGSTTAGYISNITDSAGNVVAFDSNGDGIIDVASLVNGSTYNITITVTEGSLGRMPNPIAVEFRVTGCNCD